MLAAAAPGFFIAAVAMFVMYPRVVAKAKKRQHKRHNPAATL